MKYTLKSKFMMYLALFMLIISFSPYILSVELGMSHCTSCQFQSFTFAELGYNTTTYRHNQYFYLEINCTGSTMSYYTVKIYLHASGYRMAVRYIVNGGTLYDYPLGVNLTPKWGNLTIAPGQFLEGSNEFKFDNVALNADPEGYVTFFADSYIEVLHENDSITTSSLTTSETSQIGELGGLELFIGGILFGIFLSIGALYLYNYQSKKKGGTDISWITNQKDVPKLSSKINGGITHYSVRHSPSKPECSICRKEITLTDAIAVCPYCQNRFHQSHFEESLKTKGKCPICQQEVIRKY